MNTKQESVFYAVLFGLAAVIISSNGEPKILAAIFAYIFIILSSFFAAKATGGKE